MVPYNRNMNILSRNPQFPITRLSCLSRLFLMYLYRKDGKRIFSAKSAPHWVIQWSYTVSYRLAKSNTRKGTL